MTLIEHRIRIFAIILIALSFRTFLFSQSKAEEPWLTNTWEEKEKTGFPEFAIVTDQNTTPGYYVFAISPYLGILDHWGNPMFYRKISSGVLNFTPQVNGLFSFYDNATRSFNIMNHRYQVIDTLSATSGYTMDAHDLVLMEDGSSILMMYDLKQVDMSLIFPGGSSNATVKGTVIQELDPYGEVIFQWESWDHFDILDCDTNFVDLTARVIDYVHANAITIDWDGHLLLSCRHMSEITKIHRSTGEIIWRLGGKKNEFQFIDDPIGFSGQHSPSRLENSNLLLFDNGNGHIPQYSSAKEYQIDEESKTVKLIRAFRQTPDVYSILMGNCMRTLNDHILVGWGKNTSGAFLTEFDEEGSVCTTVSWPNSGIYWSYGVSFMEKLPSLFPADTNSIHFGTIAIGDSLIKTIKISNDSGSEAILYGVDDENNPFFLTNSLPIQIMDDDTVELQICFRPEEVGDYASPFYLKFISDSMTLEDHLITSRLYLSGEGTFHRTSVGNQRRSNVTIYPNPFRDELFLENCEAVSRIKLVSITGVEMVQMDNRLKSPLHIRTDRFPPGVYILELRFSDGYAEKRVIIKGN